MLRIFLLLAVGLTGSVVFLLMWIALTIIPDASMWLIIGLVIMSSSEIYRFIFEKHN